MHHAKRFSSTTTALGALALSSLALAGCSAQSFDNAYDHWRAIEPHVDCPEGNLQISEEPEGDTFPAHTLAICTPADISGVAKIGTLIDDEFGFFLGIRVADNPSDAHALTTSFVDEPHTIVGDGCAVGAAGEFTDDAEIILES